MSHNHYVFGVISGWMVDGIVGLAPATAGWRQMRIAPQIGGEIISASASIITPFGELSSKWEIVTDTGHVFMRHSIPPGSAVELYLGDKGPYTMASGSHKLLWRKGAELPELKG